jgi:hypothetical protein
MTFKAGYREINFDNKIHQPLHERLVKVSLSRVFSLYGANHRLQVATKADALRKCLKTKGS